MLRQADDAISSRCWIVIADDILRTCMPFAHLASYQLLETQREDRNGGHTDGAVIDVSPQNGNIYPCGGG